MKYKILTALSLVAVAVIVLMRHEVATLGEKQVRSAASKSDSQAKTAVAKRGLAAEAGKPALAQAEPAAPMPPAPVAARDANEVKLLDNTLAMIPEGEFRQALMQLAPESRERALRKIVKLKIGAHDFATLRVTSNGHLYYICDLVPPVGTESAQMAHAGAAQEAAVPQTAGAAVPISSPPLRHSRPGATKVLYLDFNGHTVTGTNWNTASGAPAAYVAKAFNLTGDDPATFSDAEQAIIIQVWERVAEDYAPFDVDVTTEEPVQFTSTTGRAVITANTDANGVAMPSSGSGGVAYLDVFGDADYATFSSPAFVYLSDNAGNIAEAVSHELGHNMGLNHDGTVAHDAVSAAAYYNGHGTGETSWGPIMGTGYGRNVSQWSKGDYLYANNTGQDDFAIIASKLSYRVDDAGGTTATAAVAAVNGSALACSGVIAAVTDADVYAFNTGAGTVSITASPYRASSNTYGGNADLKLELLDASGTVVASADPAATTGASLSYAATAGKYFIRLSAAGAGDPFAASPTGYTSYGSAGQYTLTGSVVAASPVIVSAAAVNVGAGELVSFSVLGTNAVSTYAATGLPPGLSINATTGIISGRATATGAFTVALQATNGLGTGNGTVVITVTDAVPVITAQTSGRQPVARGASLSLGVTALSANGAPTYQWRRNGQPVLGATGSTFDLTNAATTMSGWYQVLVTNTIGSTLSAPIFVQVAPAATSITGWGLNTSGETTIPGGLNDAIAVAGGSTHALALRANGTVVAWGGNTQGEATVPAGLSDVVAIDAGYNYSLAVKADGTVQGWGYNGFQVLDVPGNLAGVVAVAAGDYHVLALKSDGTVVAWGNDSSGQTNVPAGLTNVVAIAAGPQFSLAAKSDGTVVAWGYNGNGETTVPGSLTGAIEVAAGGFHSLALKSNGTVANWGFGPYGAAPGGFNTGRKLSSGERHTVALKTDGTVAAWPTSAADGQATVPGGLTKVFDIAAGGFFSLALRDTSGPLAQTITFAALADRPFTVTPISLTATASSGLTVVFTVQSGAATVSGSTLTLTGTGTVTVRATQAGDANYAAATPVERSFVVTASFESWRQAKFTAGELTDVNVSGPTAIYGQDGLSNLVKYALGLEPKVNATSGLPTVTTTATDWVYTYTKPTSVTDVTYAVEVSTNLTTWTTSGVTLALISTESGVETWRATYPLGSATNAFFRLRVSQ